LCEITDFSPAVGYDQADPADTSDQHDEVYGYNGLYRVTDLQRGGLNATKTALSSETFAQCWGLDATGNWSNFRQDDTGDGIWDLVQGRTATTANEISGLLNAVGSSWVVPAYNAAGNLVTLPQPGSPGQTYTATYDAWNRLVQLASAGSTVAIYQYDGLGRRAVKQRYSGGVLSETRQLFYSAGWQVLEERTSTTAERQFVWGLRGPDDLVLRDRDTTGNGTLNERLYALQDPNGNVTAAASSAGVVAERYDYDAYGMPGVLTASFQAAGSSAYDWETRYAGYRWDSESGLYQVRMRYYHPLVGCFLSRDLVRQRNGYDGRNSYAYAKNNPLVYADPAGADAILVLGIGFALPALPSAGAVLTAGAWVAAPLIIGTEIYWAGKLTVDLIDAYGDYLESEALGRELEARLLVSRIAIEAQGRKRQEQLQKKCETKTKPEPKPEEINPPPVPEEKPDHCKLTYPTYPKCKDIPPDYIYLLHQVCESCYGVAFKGKPANITPIADSTECPGTTLAGTPTATHRTCKAKKKIKGKKGEGVFCCECCREVAGVAKLVVLCRCKRPKK
jgi:RHS repeat-associated protein